jgi:AcrR family transcriptional regulator
MARFDEAQPTAEPLFPSAGGRARGQSPERVASDQRARLEAAMVEAVSDHGYPGTTLRELVRIAGVSKSTFYEHFESKQECFVATLDEIVARVTEQVTHAYRQKGDFRERLLAALTVFMELVVREPGAARLAAVESLTLGAAGVEPRERALEAFELMIRQSFSHSPAAVQVSDMTVRAIASGIRGVVYRRLRAGTAEELPELVPELVDWAMGYQRPDSDEVRRAAAAAAEPRPQATEGKGEEPDWREPPDSPRSRAELTQRERIVRAVGRLVADKGFESLSIPAVSATAGTSNQTFYEHFGNKREAFLAAFDASAADGLAATTDAFESQDERPEAVGAGLRAMLEHIAGNELFARFTFFDLQTAGPVALDRADLVNDSFTAFLRPGFKPGVSMGEPLSPTLVHAVGSGIWSVIQHELAQGQAAGLPELAPDLVRIVLPPFATS